MREQAADFFAWLQDGALRDIIRTQGALDDDEAHAYVNELIKSHRYVRDVY